MPNSKKKVETKSVGNGTKPIVKSSKKKAKKFDITIHLFGKSFKGKM